MHERAAVTRELQQMMLETAGNVSRVTAVIGPDVDREVVVGIWEETVAGTPAVSAELVLEPAFDVLRCLDCGRDYEGVVPDTCPDCGGDGLVIERAAEFEIRSWAGPA